MSTNLKQVVSVVVDANTATFYLADGNTVVLRQGDPRTTQLVREVSIITAQGKIAEVSFDTLSNYTAITKQSGGIIKFFTVAKNKIASLFGARKEVVPVLVAEVEELLTQVTEIEPKEDETVVMVVNDAVVPNVEKISPLIKAAVERKRTTGLEALMMRMAAHAGKHAHSVQDLLTFLNKSDLMIADDGTILAYRVMTKRSDGTVVDNHSKQVVQGVGYEVVVADSQIDLRRDAECSAGLHIARRSYLRNFSGDGLFLCAVAPEDVMVVPHRDPNKVRVRRYTVLAEFSPEANLKIRRGEAITDMPADAGLVNLAMKGGFPPPHTRVTINGPTGTQLVYEKLGEVSKTVYNPTDEDMVQARAVEEQSMVSEPLNMKELQEIAEIGQSLTDNIPHVPNAETVAALEDAQAGNTIKGNPLDPKEIICSGCAKSFPEEDLDDELTCIDCLGRAEEAAKVPVAPEPEKKDAKPMSRKDAMTLLVDSYQAATSHSEKLVALEDIIQLKRAAKKAWSSLGVTEEAGKAFLALYNKQKD